MPALSPCLKLVGRMSDADADDLIARVDAYIEAGVAPAEAQRTATQDILAELESERAEVVTLAEKKKPQTDNVAMSEPFNRRLALRELHQQRGVTFADASIDRGGAHSPAGPESGSPAYDVALTKTYPEDFYGPNGLRYYGTGYDAMDAEAYALIQRVAGRPNAPVTVYRAVEKGGPGKIRPGDWVTTVRGYAKDHGESSISGGYKIIKAAVHARDIWTAGDSMLEWGYHPQPFLPEVRRPSGDAPVLSQPEEPQAGPGFYSALRRELAAAKTNASPAEYWTNLIKGAVNKGAVKKDEVTWSGISEWIAEQGGKVKKADVLSWLDANGVRVEEAVLSSKSEFNYSGNEWQTAINRAEAAGDWDLAERIGRAWEGVDEETGSTAGQPQYGQYTLPGGSNYTERLLKLPVKMKAQEYATFEQWLPDQSWYRSWQARGGDVAEAQRLYDEWFSRGGYPPEATNTFTSNHWAGHPNVIGHIRLNDRVDSTGARTLFVEELQSDWGQAGKKKGFARDLSELRKRAAAADKSFNEWQAKNPSASAAVWREQNPNLVAAVAELGEAESAGGVPAAPFIDSTDKWLALTLKRVVQLAVSGGYERVAFVTGEQSAERYSLDKHLDTLYYTDNGDGTFGVSFEAKGEAYPQVVGERVTPANIEEHVGKEIAERIVAGAGEELRGGVPGTRMLRGDGLKIEARGMRQFYDSLVPAAVKTLLKRLGGGQMGSTHLKTYGFQDGKFAMEIPDQMVAQRWVKAEPGRELRGGGDPQPSFDITPALRAAVSDGLPLFSQRTMGEQSPALQELENNDELFKLPRLQGATVSEVAFDLDPTIKVVPLPGDKGRKRWRVTLDNGAFGDISIRKPNKYGPNVYGFDLNEQGESVNLVTERPGDDRDKVDPDTEDVFIDVSRMKTGQGGDLIYAVAGALAHNTGRMFIGDPNGITKTALRRRAENMLSLAMRYGTTDFLAPHPDQIKGDRSIGVPALRWVYGDDEGNAERLIALNVKAVENAVPETAHWDFDVDAGEFVHTDGLRAGTVAFVGAISRYRREGRQTLGGAAAAGRTVARAVVLRALLREASRGSPAGGGRNGVLDRLGAAARRPARNALTKAGGGLPLFSQYSPNSFGGFATEAEMLADRDRRGAENAVVGEAWKRVRAGWPEKQPDNSQKWPSESLSTYDPNSFAGMSHAEYLRRRAALSFAQVQGSSWNSPERSKWDSVVHQLADKQIDLKRVTAAIRESGVTLTDRGDAYLREELFQSRAAARANAFMNDEMVPLLTEMRAAGVDLKGLGEYLHARHAEERNVEMQARNLKRPNNDALSGMSTADANAILASASPVMARLAARVDAMVAGTRDLMEISGIEDQATVDALRNSYQFYVPLHRDEAHPEGHIAIGSGYSVKGSVIKAATGSNEPVTHELMLAHIMEMREAIITRAEKNLVSMAVYHMALTNPNPDWWAVDKPRMIDRIDERRNVFNPGLGKMEPNPNFGQVIRVVDPLYKQAANVLTLKVNGQDRTVVFNDRNERALRMAGSIKNLDVLDLQAMQRTVGVATRWLSAVNTKYNPVFTVVNAIRDVQGAAVNLTSTAINGKQAEVLNPATLAKIAREIYRKERGAPPKDPSWAGVYEDFLKRGGQTGYRAMYDNIEDRGKKLQSKMDRISGGGLAGAGQEVLDVITAANDAVENMVRVSAYKVALDQGMSKDQAASLAKNLTVNFNRKGSKGGTALGTLYMFFNASVQGNARLATTVLNGKTGKAIAAAGVTLGVLQALMAALVLDDEEEEAIPDWVKRTSWVVPYRKADGKADYVSIPMPLGLHILPNIGRVITEGAISASKGDPVDHVGRALDLAATIFDAASPMGGSESMLQLLAPSVADPVVSLAENKTGLGSPVYRERNERDAGAPGYTLGRDSTNPAYKAIAYGIHMAANGMDPDARNPERGGWASPQPEAIRLIPETIMGGVWRETEKIIDTASALAQGKELDRRRTILLSRFSGTLSGDQSPMNAYYRNLDAVEAANYGAKRAEKAGRERDSPLLGLVSRAGAVRKEMRNLIDARRELALEDGAEDQIKEIEGEMADLMREFNAEVREARRER